MPVKLFGRSRKIVVVQNELPVKGVIDVADDGVMLQDLAQNYDAEWPQNGIFCRVDGDVISSLIFLACGWRVASLCQRDNKVRLWRVDSIQFEELQPPVEHGWSVPVNALAASKDGRWIVSGDDAGVVVIWNAMAHPIERVGEFKAAVGDRRKITALDISPDSSRVAVGSGDGVMALWRIETRERILGPLQHRNLSPVSSVKFSPAGSRVASGHLAVGGGDYSIQIWHSHTGAQLESIKNPHSTYSLAWSADGHRLFSGGPAGSIRCFNVLTRTVVEWQAPSVRDLITSLCVSNSGQLLVSVSSGRICATDIWSIVTIPSYEPLRSRDGTLMAAISPDDSRLITAGKDNVVASWDFSALIHKSYLFHRFSVSSTYPEPFTYVSNAALGAWKNGNLEQAEESLGKEIEPDDEDKLPLGSYSRVNRAFLRLRQGKWGDTLKDVQAVTRKPDNCQVNLISHIAKGIACHGQGRCGEANAAFEIALRGCGCDRDVKQLFKCIKSITLLEHSDGIHRETDIDNDLPDGNLRRLVMARKLHLLIRGDHTMDTEHCRRVLALSEAVPDLAPLLHLPEVKTLSLIFNWDLRSLINDVHKSRCQAWFGIRRGPHPGAINYFLAKRTDDLSEDLESIRARLSSISEGFGDEATYHRRYDEAIAWYSEALALSPSDIMNQDPELMASENAGKATISRHLAPLSRCPQCIAHLLVKRSEAKGEMESWSEAFADAAWSIESDPTFPWGYERKFVALHAQGHFKEAVSTLRDMSSKFMDTRGPEIYQVRNYTKTINDINDHIHGIFDKSPFVLINVEDGRLYSQEKQKSTFENDVTYYRLVSESSMSTTPDVNYIKQVVEGYFCYVMFSHTWEGEEPSFEMVSKTSVYQLDPSPLSLKLQKFCEMVRDEYKPHRWSWSDTCCIDKTNRDVFEKSIRFMYKWYHNSALTLVLLAHPSKSKPPNSPHLRHNRWMFRAWTLQELLAPRIIRFYTRDWGLYTESGSFNHKTLPELQGVMTGVEDTLRDDFSPSALTVRERLRLASTRDATIKVDIAYALIGIFSSDINVDYTREGDVALGLLLQEVVNRQGDVTILDWNGTSSKFNSSVPSNLSVYKPGPYKPYELPHTTDDMVEQRRARIRDTSLEEEAVGLHNLLSTLGLPRFADRRLSLPCITFSVIDIQPDTSSSVRDAGITAYLASVSTLGEVKFKTRDTSFSELPDRRVVLVYPWIRDLLVQTRGRAGGGKHAKHTRALRLILHLEQGFRALLFAEQSDQQYRRVAADREIIVPAGELDSLEDVGVEVLEIWEKS